jgi:serine phosphatase RsbU (regulator of sigma subunit)/pSer/pThr/pTyr-binding forkhead associated (FHA) protein
MADVRLEITDGLGRRVVRVDTPVFTIGRRSKSDLCLAGTDVSRDHAQIACDGGRFILRDQQSRYGTFVNDQPVIEKPLAHGDRIRLGRGGGAELLFLVDEVGASTASGTSRSAISSVENLRQMAALLEGLRALGSGYVLDEVLTLVLDAAIEVTGAERGFIMLANTENVLQFTLARARGRVTLPGKTWDTSLKIPERVFITGETQIVSDLRDGDLAAAHLGTVALGIRHVLCAPLRLVRYLQESGAAPEARRIGVLYLDSRDRGIVLSPTAKTGIETLATDAAIAIENARLYRETLEKARLDQELRIAGEIQQGLLPEPRYVGKGIEVVGASIPCRSIGGDLFEYIDLPSGDFGFALGDVAGKGPPAALLTAALQGMFMAHAASEGGPAATLSRVNQALMRRAVQNRFVTMAYGVISPAGQLTYCNAGHNPPMLFTRGGVQRLEEGGMVLGLFGHAQFAQATLPLDPGDILVVFSDGVSEAIDVAGEEFGDDRILSCIGANLHLDPAPLLEQLLAAVRQFSEGTIQRDDVTALVLRYTGT